jgi:hypothetical protein
VRHTVLRLKRIGGAGTNAGRRGAFAVNLSSLDTGPASERHRDVADATGAGRDRRLGIVLVGDPDSRSANTGLLVGVSQSEPCKLLKQSPARTGVQVARDRDDWNVQIVPKLRSLPNLASIDVRQILHAYIGHSGEIGLMQSEVGVEGALVR